MADNLEQTIALLSAETAEALRGERLPLLFQAAGACTFELSPQLTSLVERAFGGEAGLAALREPAVLAFVGQAVAHDDHKVRVTALSLLQRLCASSADVALVVSHGSLLPAAAAKVGDAQLEVAQRATRVFVACSTAGVDALRLVLDDAPTAAALGGLAGGGGLGAREASVLQLRVLALWAEASAQGEAQCALLVARGLLAPALELWRGDDPLVRLNVLELIQGVCGLAAGFAWLEGAGLPRELCDEAATDPDADPLAALQRPALLRCLGAMAAAGDVAAASLLPTDGGGGGSVLPLLWAHLESRDAEQRDAALDALRSLACAPLGLRAIVARGNNNGGGGNNGGAGGQLAALQPLPAMLGGAGGALRGATAGAYAVLSQMCATATTLPQEPFAAVSPLLQGLFSAAAPGARGSSVGAADAVAAHAAGPLEEMRAPAMGLLLAVASLEWGATLLAASEGVLALLLSSGGDGGGHLRGRLDVEMLRAKHRVAEALLRWPHVAREMGGETSQTYARLSAYVAGGPFFTQPTVARPAEPQSA